MSDEGKGPLAPLSPIKQAVLLIDELQAKVDRLERAERAPIAVIGVGCRLPGGASSPERFWQLLRDGVDAVAEVPRERFDVDALFDADPEAPGKLYTRWAALLDRVDEFDARFFGIAPREAAGMDPQQRLLLEVTCEALERAGQPLDRLGRTRTGVFVGICTSDYARISHRALGDLDAYSGTGNSASVAAGRISYALGLEGPSLAIDTACSSSLVAVHLACRSLRAGESTLAVAGGVNLILLPDNTVYFCRLRAMSPTGRCKAFDASADGYVRGEGAGVVVLKKLEDALRDGDPVLAVIRGSAVNQDGRSNGLTAPSRSAQEALLREALAAAAVAPADIGYVEAHGTGTPLGDPIEAGALATVLRQGRAADAWLHLGSVKSNLGHLEAAAGVAGLIKVILALQHRELPPHLHFGALSPHIRLDDVPARVVTERVPWQPIGGRRLAGVSSFGFSGTNAHVILEEAPAAPARVAAAVPSGPLVLPLSARSPEALVATARALGERLARLEPTPAAAAELCAAAALERAHWEHRAAVVGATPAELADRLDDLVAGREHAGLAVGPAAGARRPRIAFVFPGQGAQWIGMGRQLLAEPAFAAAIDACQTAMRPYVGFSLVEQLTTDAAGARYEELDVIQPTLFAVQVALAALWESWGVRPAAVVGHSMGEVAAAYVAGALSLDDAARVICTRSRLATRIHGAGAMLSVELAEPEARAVAAQSGGRVALAVCNGGRSTVLSGETAAIEALARELSARGVHARIVAVRFASHSPMVDALRADLEAELTAIAPRAAAVPIASTVTGRLAGGAGMDGRYWFDNLRQPVLFRAAVDALLDGGVDGFVELSPHPLLFVPLAEAQAARGVPESVLGCMRRDHDGRASFAEAVARLYAAGAELEWSRCHRRPASPLGLPTYPWQRQRHWTAAPERRTVAAGEGLVGRRVRAPGLDALVYELDVAADADAAVADHRIFGRLTVAMACHLSRMLAAAARHHGGDALVVEELTVARALAVEDDERRPMQLVLRRDGADGFAAEVVSPRHGGDDGDAWDSFVGARVRRGDGDQGPARAREPWDAVAARCGHEVDVAGFYDGLWQLGYHLGPAYRWATRIVRGDGEVAAELRAPKPGERLDGQTLHPGLLDSFFQILSAAAPAGTQRWVYLPLRLEALRVWAPPRGRLRAHGRLRGAARADAELVVGDVTVYDEEGRVVAEVAGLHCKRATPEALRGAGVAELLYEVRWAPLEAPAAVDEPGGAAWLVFADRGGVGDALAARLRGRGERCVVVRRADALGRVGDDELVVRADAADELSAVIEPLFAAGAPGVRGVAYLWALDVAAATETEEAIADAETLACVAPLQLVQALTASHRRRWPRLLLATLRSQETGGGSPPRSPLQSLLWGLGNVVATEHPELGCVRVDLERGDADAAEAIEAELRAAGGEDQLAHRGRRRFGARLVRAARLTARELRVSATGAYLVTGGLGALGLEVAAWLVERGARHLVLVSRRGRDDRAAAIAALRARGARVAVACLDVADRVAVDALAARLGADGVAVRGIVHAAGVIDDGMIFQQTAARLRDVLLPKLRGALAVAGAFAGAPLDFCVYFSSGAALFPSPGQAGYAAANAFLDALAGFERAAGRPSLAIDWGAWAEIGLAAQTAARRGRITAAGDGSTALSPARGIAALERALTLAPARLVVVDVDWPTALGRFGAGAVPPLFSELGREQAAATTDAATPRLVETLRALPAAQRKPELIASLRRQVGRVLSVDDATQLPLHKPLRDFGMDSLMAVELRNALGRLLGKPLPVTALFDHPTIDALAGWVLRELVGVAEPAPPVAPPAEETAPARDDGWERIAGLSSDELLRALDDELEAFEDESGGA